MVSEIVKVYLRSEYRSALRSDSTRHHHAVIHIEEAKIVYGRKDDDLEIIDFLKGLGNVKVEVVSDGKEGLVFKPGTFDNWIPMEKFERVCREWTGGFNQELYYDSRKERLSKKHPDRLTMKIHPVNCLFKIKGGPNFPPVLILTNAWGSLCWLWHKGYRRRELELEKPFNLRTYDYCSERCLDYGSRGEDIVIVAEDHNFTLTITRTDVNWMTRAEAVRMLNRGRSKGVVIGNKCIRLDSDKPINISCVHDHGVVNFRGNFNIDRVIIQEMFRTAKMDFSQICVKKEIIRRDIP